MPSPYPQYLDKAITIRTTTDLSSTVKPTTSETPELYNWLANKLVATQKEARFDIDSLNSNLFGLPDDEKTFGGALSRRLKIEGGKKYQLFPYVSGGSRWETVTILFNNTTSGGTTQRFDAGVEPTVFLISRYWTAVIGGYTETTFLWGNSTHNFIEWTDIAILYDSNNYPYGFTLDHYVENNSSTKETYFVVHYMAVQGWGQ